MRFATCFLVLTAAASWGVGVSAQAVTFGRRPSPPAQLAFHFPGFDTLMSALRVNRAARRGLGVASRSDPVGFLGQYLSTCPMPVAHTDSAKEDPMPVARGGTTEPMPVAKSGCWNPLNPSH
jgi:hypothetical protein